MVGNGGKDLRTASSRFRPFPGVSGRFPLDCYTAAYYTVLTRVFENVSTNHRHFLRRAFPLCGECSRMTTTTLHGNERHCTLRSAQAFPAVKEATVTYSGSKQPDNGHWQTMATAEAFRRQWSLGKSVPTLDALEIKTGELLSEGRCAHGRPAHSGDRSVALAAASARVPVVSVDLLWSGRRR